MSDKEKRSSNDDFLFILAGIIFIVVGVFYLAHDKMVAYYRTIYGFLASLYYQILPIDFLKNIVDRTTVYEASELTLGEMYGYSFIQIPIILIFIGILSYFFVPAILKNKSNIFRRNFNDKNRWELVKAELPLWKWTAPVIGKKINEQSLREGDWAMPLTPLEFCRKYQLLNDNNTVNREKTNIVFLHQLGNVWKGFDYLKPEEQALLACFAAQASKIQGGQAEAQKYLGIMSLTSVDKIDFSWAKQVWDKYKDSDYVKKVVYSYGYNYTVLSSMLLNARLYGKLPNSYFLWLKPYNRELYFVLRSAGSPIINTGPQVPFVEGAAAFAHRLAEESNGKPILRPFISTATEGVVEYIEQIMDIGAEFDEYQVDNLFKHLEEKEEIIY